MHRHRLVSYALTPPWDLTLVLCLLIKAQFEPLNQGPLKFFVHEDSFAAGSDICKESVIYLLSVAPSCIRIPGDCSSAVLHPNPTFTPKIITNSFMLILLLTSQRRMHALTSLLRLVHAQSCYIVCKAAFCCYKWLFVYYRESSHTLAVSNASSGSDLPEGLSSFHQRDSVLHIIAWRYESEGHLHCSFMVLSFFFLAVFICEMSSVAQSINQSVMRHRVVDVLSPPVCWHWDRFSRPYSQGVFLSLLCSRLDCYSA